MTYEVNGKILEANENGYLANQVRRWHASRWGPS